MREQDLLKAILSDPPPISSQDCRGGAGGVEVVTGPGDDCAVIKPAGMGPLLVTVDQVIDGLHVTAASTPWNVIGHKAVRRSVSDIAAMAGQPLASVISVVLPGDAQHEQCELLRKALGEAAAACGAPLVGGDIAVHRHNAAGAEGEGAGPLTLSVTVLGVPTQRGPVLRSGGIVGDRVWTTGVLGRTLDADGGGHHLHIVPRVDVALALHEAIGESLHAMIDISDGLGRDGARLAEASRCTMQVRAADVPRRNGATWQEALHDGEDYELLCAIACDAEVPPTLCGVPMTCVGELIASDNRGDMLVVLNDGEVVCGDDAGWDHGK